jgi:hypothetical protein
MRISDAGLKPVVALRAYAAAKGVRVRSQLVASANVPGGARVWTRVLLHGRSVRLFAGPSCLELETKLRGPASFSINQPDQISGAQRVRQRSGGLSVHASSRRDLAAGLEWLTSPHVRTDLDRIAAVDAGFGLHVNSIGIDLVAATDRLDVLEPAFLALAGSLDAAPDWKDEREGGLPAELAMLMRFKAFAIPDDLQRSALVEERADDVERVVRDLEPFVPAIESYLRAPDLEWTDEVHALSALLELVYERTRRAP